MSKAWFAPKTFGYGAGLPIAWQGWMVLGGFIAAEILLNTLGPIFLPVALLPPVTIGANLFLIAAVVIIARAKTEGGWRWRWGNDL